MISTSKNSIVFLLILQFGIATLSGCTKDDPEAPTELCSNGIDDDEDGFVDLDDVDCTETGDECTNGIDDDGDGYVDCDDLDCTGNSNC